MALRRRKTSNATIGLTKAINEERETDLNNMVDNHKE
jgi:hypothetical protein